MTIAKKTVKTTTIGSKTITEETVYYEVGAAELDNMITKVDKGGDEQQLRDELIKKSKWGEK